MYFLCGLYASKRIENAKPLELMPGSFRKELLFLKELTSLCYSVLELIVCSLCYLLYIKICFRESEFLYVLLTDFCTYGSCRFTCGCSYHRRLIAKQRYQCHAGIVCRDHAECYRYRHSYIFAGMGRILDNGIKFLLRSQLQYLIFQSVC